MIDIHGGGSDLMFPHHENERAQAIALDHHGLAKYWMHNARLDVDQQKMSKSLGNVVLVKDLIDIEKQAFRLLILAHHYRQPIQYSQVLLEQYMKHYVALSKKIRYTVLELKALEVSSNQIDSAFKEDIISAMCDDFHTPTVVTKIFELHKTLNKSHDLNEQANIINTFVWLLPIIGIQLDLHVDDDVNIYLAWQKARENKDFDLADTYRDQLTEKGYI
jgi:cysteinyl-tRNA synthetase